MFEIFSYSFDAVAPILILVALGYCLKKINFASEQFFKTANSLVFRVFLPLMLFWNIYKIESLSGINWPAIIYCMSAVLIIAFIGYIVSKLITKDKSKIGVLTQCAFRSNHAIIGLPLAQMLGGVEAVAFASVLSAAVIPLFNTLAVFILSYHSNSENSKPNLKDTLIKTVKNPLIIAVACGIGVLIIRSFIPIDESGNTVFTLENNCKFIASAIESASKVASPLALVVMGAQLDLNAVKSLFREISAGVFMRLVMSPAIAIFFAYFFTTHTQLMNIGVNEYPALISVFASPVAVSSAVMVGEIGGDEQLAAQLVVWTSVFSMFSIFSIVFLLKSFSLL